MKTANIYVLVGASDDLPDSTSELYQQAATSLVIRKTLENAAAAGMQLAVVETSDFNDFRTNLSAYLTNAYARETEIINDGVATTVANLPDILSIGSAFASGGASAAAACILNIMLGKLLGGDSGARGDYRAGEAGGDVDFTDLIAKLEEIREQIEQTLDEFNINLFNDEFAQSWSVGPVAEE